MPIQYDFKGKTVVVTGGAQGIGVEIVKSFLTSGAKVSVWDYNAQALESMTSELKSYSSMLETQQVDVGQYDSCRAAAEKTKAVDVLVNNAGITRDKSFAKMTTEDFTQVITTNLTGLFNVTKSILDTGHFNEASTNKRIINMASVVALYGNFGQTNYAAAKAAVRGFTQALAMEVGRYGIRVNLLVPGMMTVGLSQRLPKHRVDDYREHVSTHALVSPEDVARTAIFLVSDRNTLMTAASIAVDGGL